MVSDELIPGGVPLSGSLRLSDSQISTLSSCWITTAQELVALGQEPLRALLARALGVDEYRLRQILQAAQQAIPAIRALPPILLEPETIAQQYGLGAILHNEDEVGLLRSVLPTSIPPRFRGALPPSVDHLSNLPPLRDQGGRGTCVAYGVLAVREYLEIAAGSSHDIDLSEQFVYWWCKQHDGIPSTPGTYVSTGMRCLQEVGAPTEETWPYVREQLPDEGQGPPPPEAASGGPAFRSLHTVEFNPGDISGIKASLHEGHCLAFAVPVFNSWYISSATQRWGKITLPLPGEKHIGGHALTLVGYQDDATAPGGGYFLVRNSWQPWSMSGVWEPGYGYIPYAYIARYAQDVMSTERVAEARAYIRDDIADTGSRPLSKPAYNSPDIWLRRAADGETEDQPPAAGQRNYAYVRAFNSGPAYLYGAELELAAAPIAPVIQSGAWQVIGKTSIERFSPTVGQRGGQLVAGPFPWVPVEGQYAFRARLTIPGSDGASMDPRSDGRVAQRKAWFLPLAPGAAGEVAFTLVCMPGSLETLEFQVEQADLPASATVSPIEIHPVQLFDVESGGIDPASGDGSDILDELLQGAVTGAIVSLAGERWQVRLRITLPLSVRPGARYSPVLIQRQNGKLVGQVTIRVQVI